MELGRTPIDFEGTLTGIEPCSSDNCELNTIMRIEMWPMTPLHDKFRLELSFFSNPNRDQLENVFNRYEHPQNLGFRFKSKFRSVFNQYISEILYYENFVLNLLFHQLYLGLQKLEARLKIEIPLYNVPSYPNNAYDRRDDIFLSGSKADFELKLLGEIPEKIRSGDGRPGAYIFSSSAKVTKFGKIFSRYVFLLTLILIM